MTFSTDDQVAGSSSKKVQHSVLDLFYRCVPIDLLQLQFFYEAGSGSNQ